jgi:hypothetical protein
MHGITGIGQTGTRRVGRRVPRFTTKDCVDRRSRAIVVLAWFALNVNTDLRYFDLIVPCGISGVTMTSVPSSSRVVEMHAVHEPSVFWQDLRACTASG